MGKARKDRRAFNRTKDKKFAWIKDLDIGKEYINIKCGMSQLSIRQKTTFHEYIAYRVATDPKFKEFIQSLDTMIVQISKKHLADMVPNKESENESTNNS